MGAQEAVRAARAAGVQDMVTVGIDVASSRTALDLADELGVWASIGLHPNSASELTEKAARELTELAGCDRVVAVGESGLDFYRDAASPEDQAAAFSWHVQLAKESDKALIIHTRDSLDRAMEQLTAEGPPPRLVFHCWSGTPEELDRALGLGAFVSFAGNVSFKSAQNLRQVAKLVPEDRLLVETDSPYLAPVPRRGRPNAPALVPLVGAAIAEARGVSSQQVAEVTAANARRLFGLEQ